MQLRLLYIILSAVILVGGCDRTTPTGDPPASRQSKETGRAPETPAGSPPAAPQDGLTADRALNRIEMTVSALNSDNIRLIYENDRWQQLEVEKTRATEPAFRRERALSELFKQQVTYFQSRPRQGLFPGRYSDLASLSAFTPEWEVLEMAEHEVNYPLGGGPTRIYTVYAKARFSKPPIAPPVRQSVRGGALRFKGAALKETVVKFEFDHDLRFVSASQMERENVLWDSLTPDLLLVTVSGYPHDVWISAYVVGGDSLRPGTATIADRDFQLAPRGDNEYLFARQDRAFEADDTETLNRIPLIIRLSDGRTYAATFAGNGCYAVEEVRSLNRWGIALVTSTLQVRRDTDRLESLRKVSDAELQQLVELYRNEVDATHSARRERLLATVPIGVQLSGSRAYPGLGTRDFVLTIDSIGPTGSIVGSLRNQPSNNVWQQVDTSEHTITGEFRDATLVLVERWTAYDRAQERQYTLSLADDAKSLTGKWAEGSSTGNARVSLPPS